MDWIRYKRRLRMMVTERDINTTVILRQQPPPFLSGQHLPTWPIIAVIYRLLSVDLPKCSLALMSPSFVQNRFGFFTFLNDACPRTFFLEFFWGGRLLRTTEATVFLSNSEIIVNCPYMDGWNWEKAFLFSLFGITRPFGSTTFYRTVVFSCYMMGY